MAQESSQEESRIPTLLKEVAEAEAEVVTLKEALAVTGLRPAVVMEQEAEAEAEECLEEMEEMEEDTRLVAREGRDTEQEEAEGLHQHSEQAEEGEEADIHPPK